MRVPESPPPYQSLLHASAAEPKRLIRLLSTRAEDLPRQTEYLHWDKVRRLTPPEDFSKEEWWWIIKTSRLFGRQQVPLSDKKRQPFSFSLAPEMFELLHHIDQRCAGNIAMPEQVINTATRGHYQVHSLMEEAVTSSLLEGAAVTREKARDMLRSGRKPHDKGERMIVNNFLTMQHLQNIKDQPLTPELVIAIHAMISQDALDKPDAAGRLRRADEYIEVSDDQDNVFHIPPAAAQLPERLAAMCAFANDLEIKGY